MRLRLSESRSGNSHVIVTPYEPVVSKSPNRQDTHVGPRGADIKVEDDDFL